MAYADNFLYPHRISLHPNTKHADLVGSGVGRDELLRGACAIRSPGEPWNVRVSLAEFVRVEPLQSEMARVIESALAGVAGVTQVARQDKEAWLRAIGENRRVRFLGPVLSLASLALLVTGLRAGDPVAIAAGITGLLFGGATAVAVSSVPGRCRDHPADAELRTR